MRPLPPGGRRLLVLTAGSAQFQRAPGRAGEFRLVLGDVSRAVTGFSDRPARVLGRQSLTSFVRGWDSVGFGRVPPNAALVVDAERRSEEVVVLELLRPKLGPGRTVTFGAKALGHRPDGILQRIARGAHDPRTDRFGRVSLFIDPTGRRRFRLTPSRSTSCSPLRPAWVRAGTSASAIIP
jgi:hypothetical protein